MTMQKLMCEFWADEQGFLISMELVLIATIGVLGLIVGLSCLANAVVGELQDLGWAVRSLNQSYYFGGFRGCKSWVPGSSFFNRPAYPLATNWDNNWDIGVTAPSLAYPAYVNPGTAVIPGVQTGPTIICPPGTTGQGVVVPGAVTVPGPSLPCPSGDCATVPAAPTGPVTPVPDDYVPRPAEPLLAPPPPPAPVQ
jgi:Flp pilus assembly pilin Flp